MDSFKAWMVNVGLKEMGPSAVRGAILGAAGWFALHNGLVPGIVTQNNVTTIDWSKVSDWAIAGLPALTAAVIKMLNYHAVSAIKGKSPTGEN